MIEMSKKQNSLSLRVNRKWIKDLRKQNRSNSEIIEQGFIVVSGHRDDNDDSSADKIIEDLQLAGLIIGDD
jgi:hypothetical protein